MRLTIIICSLVVFFSGFSQNIDNQQKIKSSIQNYFHFDSENIHVQFNKKIYVNNEDLAFKGYVYSKDDSAPHLNTTNIQLIIYNQSRQIVQKQLLYTTLGTFEGGLHLNEKFTSGKYYFQFYTNWMNNFKEDDSFVETIEIISDAQSADQKLVTSNFSLQRAVSINMAALITKVNKPKVRRIAGSVKSLRSEPIRPLIKPNRSATQRYVQAPPFTVTPLTKEVAAQKASALAIRRTINFID